MKLPGRVPGPRAAYGTSIATVHTAAPTEHLELSATHWCELLEGERVIGECSGYLAVGTITRSADGMRPLVQLEATLGPGRVLVRRPRLSAHQLTQERVA